MRTLIFNGSARKNGDTQSLIEELTRQLEGEVRIVNAHDCNVRACIDCRRCWEKPECSIQDDWQQIDPYLRSCDNVVIASPVYFCEITGPVLSTLSRLQLYWAARNFRTGHSDSPHEHCCGAVAADERAGNLRPGVLLLHRSLPRHRGRACRPAGGGAGSIFKQKITGEHRTLQGLVLLFSAL